MVMERLKCGSCSSMSLQCREKGKNTLTSTNSVEENEVRTECFKVVRNKHNHDKIGFSQVRQSEHCHNCSKSSFATGH